MSDELYPPDEDDETKQAVQSRCPHCLGEQYVLNVLYFSAGQTGCTVCGRLTTPMTERQWRDALRATRQQRSS